jgi:hypothetical protein
MARPSEALTDEVILRDRARLISANQFARVLNMFVEDVDMRELEFYCPEAGTMLDTGQVFVESPGVNAETMYHGVYDAAKRGHWLRRELWVKKKGCSTWVYKYDPKAVKE